MAILMKSGGEPRVALAARGLVGRSSACILCLPSPLASGEHALISHAQGAWSVRDLGSRNGTWLNGERLPAGGTRALVEGDELAFGDPATVWILVDASPPLAMARRLGAEIMIAAEHGMLALPSAEAPRACVFEGKGGAWVVEIGAEARPARDGEVLHIEGEAFMLHLPEGLAATAEDASTQPCTDDLALTFRVSRDEEHVEVSAELPSGRRVLTPRAHHYTLLTLARARLRDSDAPALVEAQRGWVVVDDLCRSLAMEESRLNVEVHRIRQDFAGLGLYDAPAVIERRRGSRQLRLGPRRVAVEAMDGPWAR